MLNNLSIIGRLTKDPDCSYTSSGIALAKFRIACDRGMKDAETGERTADFFDVVCWRQTAEFVSQYITKGRMVGLTGRIQSRNWVAQDGTKRYTVEIVAERVDGLDRPKDENGEGAPYREAANANEQRTPAGVGANSQAAVRHDLDDDNDPFADE